MRLITEELGTQCLVANMPTLSLYLGSIQTPLVTSLGLKVTNEKSSDKLLSSDLRLVNSKKKKSTESAEQLNTLKISGY